MRSVCVRSRDEEEEKKSGRSRKGACVAREPERLSQQRKSFRLSLSFHHCIRGRETNSSSDPTEESDRKDGRKDRKRVETRGKEGDKRGEKVT